MTRILPKSHFDPTIFVSKPLVVELLWKIEGCGDFRRLRIPYPEYIHRDMLYRAISVTNSAS